MTIGAKTLSYIGVKITSEEIREVYEKIDNNDEKIEFINTLILSSCIITENVCFEYYIESVFSKLNKKMYGYDDHYDSTNAENFDKSIVDEDNLKIEECDFIINNLLESSYLYAPNRHAPNLYLPNKDVVSPVNIELDNDYRTNYNVGQILNIKQLIKQKCNVEKEIEKLGFKNIEASIITYLEVFAC
jgi:hypothetical protein